MKLSTLKQSKHKACVGEHSVQPVAQIVFTQDFHELLTGCLHPKGCCHISYDPKRITKESPNYVHGCSSHNIICHYQFISNGPVHSIVLVSHEGILTHPIQSLTGDGSMLRGHFDIPANAEKISIWFSYTDLCGSIHYDSDFGKNYNFPFLESDILGIMAGVDSNASSPYRLFNIEVETAAAITEVSIRLSTMIKGNYQKQNLMLQKNANGIWQLSDVPVPWNTPMRFKVLYSRDDVHYKDDNNGHYFLVD